MLKTRIFKPRIPYKNIRFDPNVFYKDNDVLMKEKSNCLFCSKKAIMIICNKNSNDNRTFVSIRHCNSLVCRHLAIKTFKKNC